LGGCEKIDNEQAIQEAVELASKSDVVVFIGGLTPEWESEGFDRPTLDMPGLQNQTIARLAAANQNTVVVIQAVCPPSLYYGIYLNCLCSTGIGCVNALG
jgi:beta-glucosidase